MEQDLNAILEQQLRGLHIPEASGFWPPAFGWWILAALVLGLIILTILKLIAVRKAGAYKKQALFSLNQIHKTWQQHQDSAIYLQEINRLLKRTVMSSGAAPEKAAETSADWAYTLRTASKKPLNDESVEALTTALYQAKPKVDIAEIHQSVRLWLNGHIRPENAQSISTARKKGSKSKGGSNA